MLDWKRIEAEFPTLSEVVFLNSAQVSIPPVSVQEAYFGFTRQYIDSLAAGVVAHGWEVVSDARRHIARLIGAAPSEIGFVKNTSEGVGIVANGYPFVRGDNVVVIDQEHPTNLLPWIQSQSRGVELRVAKSQQGAVRADEVIALMDHRTRVVAISAVQFSTGAYADLAALGEACRVQGVLLAVDGIQAIGRLAIDVKALGVGYLACGGNKGLLAMLGAGFVFCDREWVERIIPPYVSYQSVRSAENPPSLVTNFSTIDWHHDSRRFESGNLNYAGIAAMGAGGRLLNDLGIEEIQTHILAMQDVLLDRLRDSSLQFRTPLKREYWSGILCLDYPKAHEQRVHAILEHHRVVATYRGGYVRLCINFYNTRDQIERTAEALDAIGTLPAGRT